MRKKQIKKFAAWLFKAFVAGLTAIAIISVAAFFYNYTGIHVTNHSGATDYSWQKNQQMNNMKEGFASVKMDENGFNNTAVSDEIDILLMGSSHMEAYQVAQTENCGYLLNKYLPDFFTYNIGISGHTIYRIADNIEAALSEYSPSEYVLIETNTVQLSISEMNKVISGEAARIPSHDSGILFWLQKIPAFKPLYNQFDNWINIKTDTDSGEEYEAKETVISDEYRTTLLSFLSIIKNASEKHGIVPVIFYAPNESLNENGTPVYQTDTKYLEAYDEACSSLGIVFTDMSDSFLSLYNEQKVLAHGFSNTAVGAGHLNRYGHEAVAQAVADKIRETEGK